MKDERVCTVSERIALLCQKPCNPLKTTSALCWMFRMVLKDGFDCSSSSSSSSSSNNIAYCIHPSGKLKLSFDLVQENTTKYLVKILNRTTIIQVVVVVVVVVVVAAAAAVVVVVVVLAAAAAAAAAVVVAGAAAAAAAVQCMVFCNRTQSLAGPS